MSPSVLVALSQVSAVWLVVMIVRAWRTGTINFGGILADRKSNARSYWLLIVMYAAFVVMIEIVAIELMGHS